MRKFLILTLALLVLGAGLARAGTVKGTVQAVKADTLVIKADVHGLKWVKVGKQIKVDKKKGVVIAVTGDSLVTVVTPKAKVKPGEQVKLKKARRVVSGC